MTMTTELRSSRILRSVICRIFINPRNAPQQMIGFLLCIFQLGFVYDLILHLINQYDVRSNDFREMVSSYFGARTAHFQHELYHFVVSGMSMEEYDRMAAYPAPGSRSNAGSSSNPEVITLSDEEGDGSQTNRPGGSGSGSSFRPQVISEVVLLDSSSSGMLPNKILFFS